MNAPAPAKTAASAKATSLPAETETAASGLPAAYDGNQSLAVSLARAEVDQQIATARALPRSITRAVQNITTLATLDEQTAEECIYALPRAGKAITGPSIRLAEIIASQWGNCRVGARVVHVDRFEKYVEAEGVFHDLETNTATTAWVRRRLSDKYGKLLSEDMIIVTGNAACSIAKRNAIVGGVPKAVWRPAYSSVEGVIAGDIKTLAERREKAMKAFAIFGVTPDQVLSALGVAGLDDVGLSHMTTLTGMHSALKSGEANVEEMFPKAPAADRPKNLGDALDRVAAKPAADGKPVETKTGEAATATTDVQQPAAKSTELPPFPGTENPDEFLKWTGAVLSSVADGGALQSVFKEHVAPHVASLMPPDQEEVADLLKTHQKRLGGE